MSFCHFKKRECRENITTIEGTFDTCSYIKRLSNLGKTNNPIDTSIIGDDYMFKQTSPRRIAELYSRTEFGVFAFHFCKKCRKGISKVLKSLDLIESD